MSNLTLKKYLVIQLILMVIISSAYFFLTTDLSSFKWAMEKGGITYEEFSAYGKLQYVMGIVIGMGLAFMSSRFKPKTHSHE